MESGLTDYGRRIIELNKFSRREVAKIYAEFFGVNPPRSVPKYRLCLTIAEWEADYDRDGNLIKFNSNS